MVDNQSMQINLSDRYKRSDQIVSRVIQGEAVLVPLRAATADLEYIYALNETAALVWQSLDGSAALSDVLARILGEFDVPEQQAEQDLIDLMARFVELGAVVKV